MKNTTSAMILINALLTNLTLNSCAKSTVIIKNTFSNSNPKPLIVKTIIFDEYYRPVLGERTDRPGTTGEIFHLVFFNNNKPILSYNIIVGDFFWETKFNKPYESIRYNPALEKSLIIAELGLILLQSGKPGSIRTGSTIVIGLAYLLRYLFSPSIKFLPNIVRNTETTSDKNENPYVISNKETFLSTTRFLYDENRRIISMEVLVPFKTIGRSPVIIYDNNGRTKSTRYIPADTQVEIFKALYFYKNNKLIPDKVIISKSFPEKSSREINFKGKY